MLGWFLFGLFVLFAIKRFTGKCQCPHCDATFRYYEVMFLDSFLNPPPPCPSCGKGLPQPIPDAGSLYYIEEREKVHGPLHLC